MAQNVEQLLRWTWATLPLLHERLAATRRMVDRQDAQQDEPDAFGEDGRLSLPGGEGPP